MEKKIRTKIKCNLSTQHVVLAACSEKNGDICETYIKNSIFSKILEDISPFSVGQLIFVSDYW